MIEKQRAILPPLTPQQFGFIEHSRGLVKEVNGTSYLVEKLKSIEQLEEAVSLQQDVWELDDKDVCPAHMWITGIDTGGHVLGVRNEEDKLVAFAAGFGGYDCQERIPFVLSDMVAVRSDLRDQKIGYVLKLAQILHVRSQGIPEIRWTYDPLRSRNAYLNLQKLGGVVTDFVINKYGDSLSGSQNTDITDRFLVRWSIDDPKTIDYLISQKPRREISNIQVVNPDAMIELPEVAVGIPHDIGLLTQEQKIEEQLRFRVLATRYINELGYRGVDYQVAEQNGTKRGYYIFQEEQAGIK